MNPNHLAAYRSLEQAQKALRAGDKSAARHYAVQAAQLAPDMEEVWLMMAALAAPRASVAYLEKAIEINPQSERARKGMVWAVQRLREHQAKAAAAKPAPATAPIAPAEPPAQAKTQAKPRSRNVLIPILLILLCLAGAFAIWSSVTPARALLAELFSPANAPAVIAPTQASQPDQPAQAGQILPTDTANPLPTTAAATDTPLPTSSPLPSPTSLPSETPTPFPTATAPLPSETPTFEPSPTETPAVAQNPGELPTLQVEFPPTETPAPTYDPSAVRPAGVGPDENWIDVDLSRQALYAYTGDNLVASFIVSTGTYQYPTVTGQYRVYWRLRYKDMSGPGYYLPDVPFTMFFYKGYAIHGTYWHNNFGTPMSHGCVNMTIADAEWIYNFSQVGTLVNVHY
jgi:lipoprotein-anchoring transpeptidase ErfK/SrfK